MKKRITMLTLLIIVVTLCIFTQGTFAWFTDVVYNQRVFQIGNIEYVYSGTLLNSGQNELVVPGQPLITSDDLYLTNQSTIDTNLRVLIEFTYTNQLTQLPVQEIYTGTAGQQIENFMDIQMVAGWTYNSTDSCWHYLYNGSENIPASTTTGGYSFDLIDSVNFDGNLVDMSLSGAIFKLTFVFQAKQTNFVNWQTIGTQDIDNLAAG